MTILAFLVMLGVLITIHEFGHFLFARMFGVKVETFSIGFGPPIFRWKGKETEYQIALIPLGGYVKMYGEDSMTEPVQGEVNKEAYNDPRSFHSKARWQKMLIAFAGPLFNIILAIVLFIAVYAIGIKEPAYLTQPPEIGYVEKNSIAEKIGLQPFDKILKANGEEVKNWKDLTIKLAMKSGKNIDIEFLRNGNVYKVSATLPEDMTKNSFGISPIIEPKVGKVLPNTPAEKAGLKEGDIIIAINGKPIRTWFEFTDFMSNLNEKRDINLLVKRDGKVISLMITPEYNQELKKYTIGISPKFQVKTIQYPLDQAILKAFDKTKELTVSIYKVIAGLFTGEVSFKTLGGPISIAKFSGEALETGITTFLFAMAFMSLQLGYLNLLPIPVLDGGLIFILLIESIIRRPLPEKAKEYLAYIGFALLGSLMIYVIFNDILRAIQ